VACLFNLRNGMANTYAQIYIHIVFAVQGRENLLKKENKEELHKYIRGVFLPLFFPRKGS
jgi:REP element-mobilizing transposase RayT